MSITLERDAGVHWFVKDIYGQVLASGNLAMSQGQEQSVALGTSKLGWFCFTAECADTTATRAYGVVHDPAHRRANGMYEWSFKDGKAEHKGENIDRDIFFGIWNAPGHLMQDGVDISRYLGTAMSTAAPYAWHCFMTPPITTHDLNSPLVPGRTTDFEQLENLATPGHKHELWGQTVYAGHLLREHQYRLLEMTCYFAHEFRVYPGKGAYGGMLNQEGERQLDLYMRYMARVHINQAPIRPYHYYLVLWEPNHQWEAWCPAGEEGIKSIVRAHEIAYKAIHEEYAAAGMPKKAVVLGPNSSTFYPDWHQELFDAGLAGFIDGLTTHSYFENPDDSKYVSLIRTLKSMAQTAWDKRTDKKHDRFFFFATEEGYRNGTDEVQMQALTRHMLTMLGEGFDHYQMFIYSDGAPGEAGRMGLFYNLETEPYRPKFVAPKPVATAFSVASFLLTGYKSLGNLPLTGASMGYAYSNGDDVKLAVWNYAGTAKVRIKTDRSQAIVYDIMGNGTTVDCPEGWLAINLSENVQYICGVELPFEEIEAEVISETVMDFNEDVILTREQTGMEI